MLNIVDGYDFSLFFTLLNLVFLLHIQIFYCFFVVGPYLIGLVIEEITEDDEAVSSGNNKSPSTEYLVTQSRERTDLSNSECSAKGGGLTSNPEYLRDLKDDPDSIRFVS